MPAEPPRDGEGRVVPHDHAEILDDYHVIRHTVPNDLTPDGAGGLRLNSGAYSESSDGGMSVDCAELMLASGLNELAYVADRTHGAVKIRVGDLRALGLQVGFDPQAHNPHHCSVWGLGVKQRKKVARLQKVVLRKVQGET